MDEKMIVTITYFAKMRDWTRWLTQQLKTLIHLLKVQRQEIRTPLLSLNYVVREFYLRLFTPRHHNSRQTLIKSTKFLARRSRTSLILSWMVLLAKMKWTVKRLWLKRLNIDTKIKLSTVKGDDYINFSNDWSCDQ